MFTSRVRCALLGGLLCALLAACGEGTASTPSSGHPPLPTPTPVGLDTPPPGTAYLGAYVPGGVGGLEFTMGRKLALDMHYYTWAGLFPAFQETGDVANTRTPVDSWDCQPSNAQIASGSQDALIVTRAQAIKAFGHAIFLRYMWDPNLNDAVLGRQQCHDSNDNADGTFSATQFVAAWNHIRAIFAQQGVNNVVWVWSVSAAGTAPAAYYPGDANVDWVAIDGYDTNGDSSIVPVFSSIYSAVAGYNKPVLIAETGASSTGELQVPYLLSVSPAIQKNFPLVKGFIYYDGKTSNGFSWSLDAAGANAFATVGSDPLFQAFGNL